MSPAKVAEAIEMLLGWQICVGPRKRELDGGMDRTMGRDTLGETMYPTPLGQWTHPVFAPSGRNQRGTTAMGAVATITAAIFSLVY